MTKKMRKNLFKNTKLQILLKTLKISKKKTRLNYKLKKRLIKKISKIKMFKKLKSQVRKKESKVAKLNQRNLILKLTRMIFSMKKRKVHVKSIK